ncbi:DUF1127 domain-containing protein [Terrarubrum flagellatum]|uniref:DUF1127 domain-containing protein n=1 Tax=Terrirubrum flagellatum TaxID=2895980 RepID=UPI0031456821
MFIINIIRKINEWTRYRRTVRELSTLTERELKDIGLQHGDIERMAWEVRR